MNAINSFVSLLTNKLMKQFVNLQTIVYAMNHHKICLCMELNYVAKQCANEYLQTANLHEHLTKLSKIFYKVL